jgi:hypothetical protein
MSTDSSERFPALDTCPFCEGNKVFDFNGVPVICPYCGGESEQPVNIMRHSNIIATNEGLEGKITATGYVIETHVPFVALPSEDAKYKTVRVINPASGKSVIATVLDVGPWNEHDNEYVFGGARPAAESGIDERGRTTNKAGVDLGYYVWNFLEMKDNGPVDWEFV